MSYTHASSLFGFPIKLDEINNNKKVVIYQVSVFILIHYFIILFQELHELEKRNQQLKNTINRIETEKDYYMSKLASSPEIMNICTELYGEPLDILCEIKSDNVLNH